ncbi:MAG: helix-turn-helix transcriptional regulator [Selenomonadaceae bacterium]|nr:helix-turn-helix transcriptional regulator [Selenomonadaceae bacterium]
MKFRERLIAARKSAGISQGEMATRLGVKQGTYAAYEARENAQIPSIKRAAEMAKICNVSLDYLSGLTDDPTPHWTSQENLMAPEKQTSEPREKSASTELAEIKTRLAQIELAMKDAGIKIAAPESK